MQLVAQWLSDLRRSYGGAPLIADVRLGVFYTSVKLSTGHVGVAFTPRDLNDTVCCPKSAAAAPPAGHLMGLKAWNVAEYALSPGALKRAVGVATLNAISAAAIDRYGLPEGILREDLDALDAARVAPDDEVVMVGAFTPFIKRLKGCAAGLKLIDKHRAALEPDERSMWVLPAQAGDALRRASVVIISGSTLVEGGIDELLSYSTSARVRVIAGPTTPMWPSPFFQRGVNVLGGVLILDGRDLLNIVSEGGSGYFFEHAARRVCVLDQSFDFSSREKTSVPTQPKPSGDDALSTPRETKGHRRA